MTPNGKVQVKVRSHRVPIATLRRTEPIYSTSGVLVGSRPVTQVLFGTTLDQEHRRVIDKAQRLACSLGLDLEVVDDSKSGLFSRLMARFSRSTSSYPVVMVSPPAVELTADPSPVFTRGC
jgi:hypothetical protein